MLQGGSTSVLVSTDKPTRRCRCTEAAARAVPRPAPHRLSSQHTSPVRSSSGPVQPSHRPPGCGTSRPPALSQFSLNMSSSRRGKQTRYLCGTPVHWLQQYPKPQRAVESNQTEPTPQSSVTARCEMVSRPEGAARAAVVRPVEAGTRRSPVVPGGTGWYRVVLRATKCRRSNTPPTKLRTDFVKSAGAREGCTGSGALLQNKTLVGRCG